MTGTDGDSGPGEASVLRLQRLAGLAVHRSLPVGTRARVDEDGLAYIGAGNTRPEIAARLGWTQGNVWMPEHVLVNVIRKHSIFPDPVAAANFVLIAPISVPEDRHGPEFVYFVADPTQLRNEQLLVSQSTRLVDAIVELRQVSGAILLQLFHLAPADRKEGGDQLWP